VTQKKLNWSATLPGAPQMTLSSFFWICTKKKFVLLLFCTIRNKVQYDNQIYREILREYIIFPVIINMITRCFDAALTWRIAYSRQALFYTAFAFPLFKNSHHVLHNTGMHNSIDDFQHYCYCGNKSYNWIQNEKFKACKQNILELRIDVTLQKNSKQRAKTIKPHKLSNIFWKNP